MKTLALLSQKGGSGKSTLAVHLAVIAQATGRRTVIIDLDPQRSAAGWWETRTADTPEMGEATPGDLRAVLDAARDDGVDLAVVDTRPSAGADAAAAAAVADLVLIRHRQVERHLVWRAVGGQVFVPDDDAPRPDLCRLSLSCRAHQLRGVALFPLPVEPAHG